MCKVCVRCVQDICKMCTRCVQDVKSEKVAAAALDLYKTMMNTRAPDGANKEPEEEFNILDCVDTNCSLEWLRITGGVGMICSKENCGTIKTVF